MTAGARERRTKGAENLNAASERTSSAHYARTADQHTKPQSGRHSHTEAALPPSVLKSEPKIVWTCFSVAELMNCNGWISDMVLRCEAIGTAARAQVQYLHGYESDGRVPESAPG